MIDKTRQEFFTIAYLGLEAQGWKKSTASNNMCLYRGFDGLKCAIGHCIPDGAYKISFDNGLTPLPVVMKDIGFNASYWEFFKDMQWCHDVSRSPEHMKAEFLEFAQKNNLEVPQS